MDARRTSKMADNRKIQPKEMVVKSKVKELIKEAGMNVSSDMWDELGHTVTRSIKRGIRRAKANGRKTVRASDI
jgi:histone H3/H4|tara:strand:- start:557 stop:778 length:222 start_codon:yes stop_codon:yes gene_type:complete